MAQPHLLARLIRNHPALALGLPWGLIMIIVMTVFSVLQGQAFLPTLVLHVPLYGLGGLAFGFAMKWLALRQMRRQAETAPNTDETHPPAA
ncbi:hypothetical protein [Maricaulis parjimensis]|uniref:hypothetical protein n=1 Tax=Maricaulis parjimensis TaxID=144023 RepID=UPI00193AA258|nr:hypothetical protein [Maricaulis parjimensis]